MAKSLLLFVGIFLIFSPIYGATSYTVEASVDDQIFIINHEKFEAKTYCFNTLEGDEVIFTENSAANGFCTSAKFINLRTKEFCEVWCD